jgi:hypothetical protein
MCARNTGGEERISREHSFLYSVRRNCACRREGVEPYREAYHRQRLETATITKTRMEASIFESVSSNRVSLEHAIRTTGVESAHRSFPFILRNVIVLLGRVKLGSKDVLIPGGLAVLV